MKYDEAVQLASGYAWGCEDTSGKNTASPGIITHTNGSHDFALAFAQGYMDYDSGLRFNMTNVRSAYKRWQETGGKSIFPEGDTTEEQRARHATNRAIREKLFGKF